MHECRVKTGKCNKYPNTLIYELVNPCQQMTVRWSGIFEQHVLQMPLGNINLNDNLRRIYGKYTNEYERYLLGNGDICPPEMFTLKSVTNGPNAQVTLD